MPADSYGEYSNCRYEHGIRTSTGRLDTQRHPADDHDEDLALDATAAHVRFVVDRGVHGVFPLGTNGEFPMLKPDERAAVIEAVVDEVGVEFDPGPMRRPLQRMSHDEEVQLERTLRTLDLI